MWLPDTRPRLFFSHKVLAKLRTTPEGLLERFYPGLRITSKKWRPNTGSGGVIVFVEQKDA